MDLALLDTNHRPVIKLRKSESVYSIQIFQNGRAIPFERDPSRRTLYLWNRSKRYMFFGLASSKFPEVCKIQFERPDIRVSMPMVWPGPSTKGFHKTNENFNIFVEEVKYMSDNVFWWHSDYAIVKEKITTAEGDKIQLLQGLGFLINTRDILNLKFPMCGNKFQRNDLKCPTGQERQDVSHFQTLLRKILISIGELSQLTGWVKLTVIADLPALLQYCAKQRQEIIKLSVMKDLVS